MKEKNFQLKTGWKYWDTYLSKYVNKKVNILEIGCYQGEATSWFLNNLCTKSCCNWFFSDSEL